MENDGIAAVAENVKSINREAIIHHNGKKYLSFEAIAYLAAGMHLAAAKAGDTVRAQEIRHAARIIEQIIS